MIGESVFLGAIPEPLALPIEQLQNLETSRRCIVVGGVHSSWGEGGNEVRFKQSFAVARS